MIKLNHFSKSVIGLVRKANEDSIGSLTNKQTNGYGDIFVVCDGMGGHVGGATASQTAVKCILQYFENEANSNPIIALEKAISFANQQIFGLAQQDSSLKGMGTTCTVLLCKEDKIYIAHVGDSRIYINTDNKLYRITKDHSFVQKLVDAGQLEDSEMETHPRKNELTKALGIGANVEVEVAENPILPKSGDKFLMCSDGLCGLVNDLTISNTINSAVGLDSVNELIQLAENAGGNDNISVDIIEIIQSPHSKTIFKDQGNKSFTATQVLDIPSMKGDQKWITIFKRYQVYILSALLVLLLGLGYFTYEVIKGDITFNKVDISEQELIAAPGDATENSVQDSDIVVKENTKIENRANTIEGDIKKADGRAPFSKTQEEYEQEERERINRELRILEKEEAEQSLLENARDKIDEMLKKIKAQPKKYHKLNPFKTLEKELGILEKQRKQKKTSLIELQINKVNTAWSRLDKYIAKQELKEAINKAKKQIKILLEDGSINAKQDMDIEIKALRRAIRLESMSSILIYTKELTNKEAAVRAEIEEKKATNNAKTDTLQKNK